MEVVYAENAVPHLLSGKAVSRALGGLSITWFRPQYYPPWGLLPELDVDFSVPENMMTDAKNGRLEINNAIKCNILNKAENALSEKKKKTVINNRTAALWLEYMHLLDIVCKFIRAERLGDWRLHVSTL